MNIQEIVSRPDKLPITDTEARFVVTEYIREKKGVGVVIDPNMGMLEYSMLANAYNYAKQYFLIKYASVL